MTAPLSLNAQVQSKSTHRQRVTVALVDTLPTPQKEMVAAVLREPGKDGHDVILLTPRYVSGLILDEATRVLLDSRARFGDHPTAVRGKPFKRIVLGVRGRVPTTAEAMSDLNAAQEVIRRLVLAEPRNVKGVGKVRAIDFIPPPIRARTSPRPSRG